MRRECFNTLLLRVVSVLPAISQGSNRANAKPGQDVARSPSEALGSWRLETYAPDPDDVPAGEKLAQGKTDCPDKHPYHQPRRPAGTPMFQF